MIHENEVLIEYFYKSNSTTRLKIVTPAGSYEIESVYDNARSITQFEVFSGETKSFVIEPVTAYGHGKIIMWKLSEEYNAQPVDSSLINSIGSAIEIFIN